MNPDYLSVMWTAIAPALGNHLWQSTLFAVLAGLLNLGLRRNHAGARYWIWLVASLKFLVPLSFLVALGTLLAWSNGSTKPQSGLYLAMEELSQPFAQPPTQVSLAVAPSTAPSAPAHLLPVALATAWFAGFVILLGLWYVRWIRIRAVMRRTIPLSEGREVEALHRLERIGGTPKGVGLRLSSASLEPGVFGITRPVVVWPEGISRHLSDAQLNTILAHELFHVRRRDNLAAMLHMVVEAIFWFHPLVWWLGARLVEERELACDEEVLRLGNQPQLYAESILKVCEFCIEAPLACMSGVTGAELKKRIVLIMTERLTENLSLGRKLLLAVMGGAVVAGPLVYGIVNVQQGPAQSTQTTGTPLPSVAPLPSFEVASIKPSRPKDDMVKLWMTNGKFLTQNETIKAIIEFAYDIKSDNQLSGGPTWINSEKYDIEAKEENSLAEQLQKLPFEQHADQVRLMVRGLLADRLKLKISQEARQLPVYALVVAKSGSKLTQTTAATPATPGGGPPSSKGFRGIRGTGPGQFTGTDAPISLLAEVLSKQPELGRLVIDKTGLEGNFDWTLKWTPAESSPMFKGTEDGSQGPTRAPPSDSSGPSIFTAIQEQLGLKLDPQKAPVTAFVIDYIEKPSEN